MGVQPERITDDASYVKDYGFEQYEMNCFVYFIELYFGIQLTDSEIKTLSTIIETENYLHDRLLLQNSNAPE